MTILLSIVAQWRVTEVIATLPETAFSLSFVQRCGFVLLCCFVP